MKIKEYVLSNIWKNYLVGTEGLITTDKRHIKVIFPGREQSCGPDFTDSVISIQGVVLRGDVEIHRHTSDWRAHNHQNDTRYSKVMLHVVGKHNEDKACSVETLSLEDYLSHPELYNVLHSDKCGKYRPPCEKITNILSNRDLKRLLEQNGEKWFVSKGETYYQELKNNTPEQVLYRGVMRALGYTRNKEQMTRLSSLAPISWLMDTSQKNRLNLEALLFGLAGLLPSQRFLPQPDYRTAIIEDIWYSSGIKAAMSIEDWDLFQLRLLNYPMRRIAAMACWLSHFISEDLIITLIQKMNQVRQNNITPLLKFLNVVDEEYWGFRYDFSRVLKYPSTHLIGYDRAKVIAVNIILPFLYSYADFISYKGIKDKIKSIYLNFPALAENSVYRYMLLNTGLKKVSFGITKACQQQGLIRIFVLYCKEHRCQNCPLYSR